MQSEPRGRIFDIQRFSLHNGPGIRTTVFFKGCPLNCWWCHNPESQSPQREMMFYETRCVRCGDCVRACPERAITMGDGYPQTEAARCTQCGACAEVCCSAARQMVGEEITAAELLRRVQRDQPFYDQSGGGVTISGGEPLMQPAFLHAVLQGCKRLGIHTALDTCGYASYEVIEQVRECVDLFLFDVKLMDDELHRKYTGISNRGILDNLQRLAKDGAGIILRVPVIPEVNDHEDNLRSIAALAQSLRGVQRIDLLPYHTIAADKYPRAGRTYRLPALQTPSPARMEEIAHVFEIHHLPVSTGG
jgi:pyruvate formate lyase activating enzyme